MSHDQNVQGRHNTRWERLTDEWGRAVTVTGGWCGKRSIVLAAAEAAMERSSNNLPEGLTAMPMETPGDFLRAWIKAKRWELVEHSTRDVLIIRRTRQACKETYPGP